MPGEVFYDALEIFYFHANEIFFPSKREEILSFLEEKKRSEIDLSKGNYDPKTLGSPSLNNRQDK